MKTFFVPQHALNVANIVCPFFHDELERKDKDGIFHGFTGGAPGAFILLPGEREAGQIVSLFHYTVKLDEDAVCEPGKKIGLITLESNSSHYGIGIIATPDGKDSGHGSPAVIVGSQVWEDEQTSLPQFRSCKHVIQRAYSPTAARSVVSVPLLYGCVYYFGAALDHDAGVYHPIIECLADWSKVYGGMRDDEHDVRPFGDNAFDYAHPVIIGALCYTQHGENASEDSLRYMDMSEAFWNIAPTMPEREREELWNLAEAKHKRRRTDWTGGNLDRLFEALDGFAQQRRGRGEALNPRVGSSIDNLFDLLMRGGL